MPQSIPTIVTFHNPEEVKQDLVIRPVFRRYAVGNGKSYEFGLQHEDKNVQVEIKALDPPDLSAKIVIED